MCHYQSVLIVKIGQTECILRHIIKELLLGFQIVLHRFVIVEVIAGQIGKDTSCELQSADTLLCDRVRTDLHKGILASFIRHFSQ